MTIDGRERVSADKRKVFAKRDVDARAGMSIPMRRVEVSKVQNVVPRSISNEDIGRLDVAMYEVAGVDRLEASKLLNEKEQK